MSDLFLSHTAHNVAILLIDASGSVVSEARRFNGNLVFDQMKKIIKDLPENEFRIIFWNSDMNRFRHDFPRGSDQAEYFKNGVYKLPFVVKKSTIDQTFNFLKDKINNYCLTFPHLGFENVPDSSKENWINKTGLTRIYFITDGEIGYGGISINDLNRLKNKLSLSIKKLFNNSDIQLHIITVETRNMDFTQAETLSNAAGCDVYQVIMKERLTGYITKFVSHTPNNLDGFVHINKNRPPTGFVPFQDKYFSETRTGEFITYLTGLIIQTQNEDDLLRIVQDLAPTLCALTKDKPIRMRNAIIQTFCDLFSSTSLDSMFVHFILSEAVKKETEGSANVFALYRSQLRDLYKRANELLTTDVKNAIGIKDSFLSLPIDNKIISGHSRLIEKNILLNGKTHPNASLEFNGILVPVIPFDYAIISSKMNEQCLRQWVRTLIGKMYQIDVMGDHVIYVVLSLVLRVILSDMDSEVKDSYRKLGTIMLKKKRLNTDMTELERLESGELPIPNSGRIEQFYDWMNRISNQLTLSLEPMTMWYTLCLALDNLQVINKQLVHCVESIEKNFAGIDPSKLLLKISDIVPKITYHKIPFEQTLDYQCMITLADVSDIGGYMFLPHKSLSGNTCSPINILSIEGYERLLSDPSTSICPICYNHLTQDNFAPVDKKPDSDSNLIFFAEDTPNIFAQKTYDNMRSSMRNLNINYSNNNTAMTTTTTTTGSSIYNLSNPTLNKKGILIIMKGTVGSGKSFYGMKLKESIEKMGGICFVEGTDKYCKSGMSTPEAIQKVKEELLKINLCEENKLLVVIIDSCGEHDKKNNPVAFGVDFTGWKKVLFWPNLERREMEGYLAWSLRNVLQRSKPTDSDTHCLNPETAGVNTCVLVHKKKARALFGKKNSKLIPEASIHSKESLLALLKERADKYEEYLQRNLPMDSVIERLIAEKIIEKI